MLVEFKSDYKGIPPGTKGFISHLDGVFAVVITERWGTIVVDLSTGVLKSQ